jgi:hypothetical protein
VDALNWWIPLAALLGACVPAVIIALARHKRTVTEDDAPDVLELAHELAALKKQVKRAYMSRVREGPGGPPLDQVEAHAPPELQAPQSPPAASSQDLKQRLREAAFFLPGKGPRH